MVSRGENTRNDGWKFLADAVMTTDRAAWAARLRRPSCRADRLRRVIRPNQ
jgi:hypothetical protein